MGTDLRHVAGGQQTALTRRTPAAVKAAPVFVLADAARARETGALEGEVNVADIAMADETKKVLEGFQAEEEAFNLANLAQDYGSSFSPAVDIAPPEDLRRIAAGTPREETATESYGDTDSDDTSGPSLTGNPVTGEGIGLSPGEVPGAVMGLVGKGAQGRALGTSLIGGPLGALAGALFGYGIGAFSADQEGEAIAETAVDEFTMEDDLALAEYGKGYSDFAAPDAPGPNDGVVDAQGEAVTDAEGTPVGTGNMGIDLDDGGASSEAGSDSSASIGLGFGMGDFSSEDLGGYDGGGGGGGGK